MVSLVVRAPSTEYLRASLPHAIKAGTWVLAALACLPVSRPISRAGALKCSSKLANKKIQAQSNASVTAAESRRYETESSAAPFQPFACAPPNPRVQRARLPCHCGASTCNPSHLSAKPHLTRVLRQPALPPSSVVTKS